MFLNMKRIILSIVVITLFVSLPGQVLGQASETTVASVDVVPVISITEDAPLNFGQVIPGTTSGTVTLSTSNVRTGTEDIVLYGSTSTNAAYTVAGIAGNAYVITLPIADVDVSLGDVHLVVNAFKAFVTSTGAEGLTGTLSGSGRDNIKVGAVLTLPAGTGIGRYSGTFDVSVAYN